jgi:FKBP-type peptidyl-prolyl cis-trans isomerase
MRQRIFLFLGVLAVFGMALGCGGDKKNTATPSSPTTVTGDGTSTPSGLIYWDIIIGTGATAVSGSHIKVQYTGWLLNGEKFDSSLDHGEPFSLVLGIGRVIKGWDEGIIGMKVGGKRQLRIPPKLAYGEEGSGIIPPNSILIFDIELLDVSQ